MSIDLRHKFHKDDKITMLEKDINNYAKPIVVNYITENNYYEVSVMAMGMGNKIFNKG